jgi:transcriptional regulator with XRE-family HTH domain
MTTQSDTAKAWVPSLETFGARLALIRQHEGWNIKEAALACSLAPQSWRNWENGKKAADAVTICRAISDRTGVDLHWLLTGEVLKPYGGGHTPLYFQETLDLLGETLAA